MPRVGSPLYRGRKRDGAGGKADYILGQPPRAILEAKREAVRFDTLPAGRPTVVKKLQPLLRPCRAFEEAVHQVITYCALRGARIAIVCNGPQLAIFQALTLGNRPLKVNVTYSMDLIRTYLTFHFYGSSFHPKAFLRT